jgi:peptide chain release factor 2
MLPSAKKCAVCGSIFDAPRLRTQLAAIETKLADPALWANPALSQPIMRDRKRIEAQLTDDAELERRTGDIDAYFELARDAKSETDQEVAAILVESG